MSQAIKRHGSPTMIDHTPGSAVTAGDVLTIGGALFIAHADIAASTLGAVASGGGIYDVVKPSGDGVVFAVGQDVFWDADEEEATDDPLGNKRLGVCISAAADGDSTVLVLHMAALGGVKVAAGQHTTVAAADTVVTGLSKVLCAVASLDTDPADNPMLVSCTIGDQDGTPASGSIIIKTWQNTSGSDPTPVASNSFAKLVNWIAIGV